MNPIDMKTVIVSYIISNGVCAAVATALWVQNRKRFEGIGFWLADFVMQFIALVLVALRGVVPDILSTTVSNSLIVGGTILLCVGLERFTGKRGTQIHNIILMTAFVFAHTYFVLFDPNLNARTILFSLGLLAVCSHCAWLLLYRVDAEMRSLTRGLGILFVVYCAVSIIRIFLNAVFPSGENFFNSNEYDTLMVMLYQMLFIIMTFNLFLVVNRRLYGRLERDITARKQAESQREAALDAARQSKERYKAFVSQSFEAIYRTEFDHPIDVSLPVETQIDLIYDNAYMAECNQALADMYNLPSTDAMIGVRLIDAHGGKENPLNRATFRKLIEGGYKSTNDETVERDAFGNPVWFLSNTLGIVEGGHLIRLWGTSINITERKHADETLEQRTRELGERIKELNCLYSLSDLVEASGNSIEALMQGAAELLPPAWQYPSSACARVMLDGQPFSTSNFLQTPWSQQRPILVNGVQAGSVEVCYLEANSNREAAPFLQQEGRLLDAIAERLGKAVERIRAQRALRESEERYRLLFETMAQGIVYQAADGHIISANSTAEKILGLTLDQMQGRKSVDPRWRAIHEDGSPFLGETHPSIVALQAGAPVSNVVMGVFNPQLNENRWINICATPQFMPGEASPYQVYTTFDDITERKHADETFQVRLRLLEHSASLSLEELMQKALDEIGPITNSPIGFYHFVKPDQQTLSLQAWSTRTLNEFCKAEGKGMHYQIKQAGVWTECIIERKPVIHNDYPALPASRRKGLPPGHADVIRELVVPILRNGLVVSILGVGNKPSDYTERDVRFVSYIADIVWEIVERKRAEEKLQQLSRAVEQSPASIVITNTQGKIEYVNPRFSQVTGYSAEEAIGQNPRILKTELTPDETYQELWRTIVAGKDWQGEFINRKKNGEIFYELASISPILDAHGSITHYVAVKENITERKESQLRLRLANERLAEQIKENLKLQEILREQAIRDPLTGLYNRRYLNETVGRELARSERESYPVSFMMIDIDRFKHFNDTYGHPVGDKVLAALGCLLNASIRLGDIACRYGGEEFVVIMPEADEMDAARRAEEIRRSFDALHINYEEVELSATISVGIAFFPQHGNDADAVIKAADAALYKAKAAGRNRVHVWGEDHELAGSQGDL